MYGLFYVSSVLAFCPPMTVITQRKCLKFPYVRLQDATGSKIIFFPLRSFNPVYWKSSNTQHNIVIFCGCWSIIVLWRYLTGADLDLSQSGLLRHWNSKDAFAVLWSLRRHFNIRISLGFVFDSLIIHSESLIGRFDIWKIRSLGLYRGMWCCFSD